MADWCKKHAFSILRLEVLQKIVLKILWQYYMEICRTRYNILLLEIFLALHEIEKSMKSNQNEISWNLICFMIKRLAYAKDEKFWFPIFFIYFWCQISKLRSEEFEFDS